MGLLQRERRRKEPAPAVKPIQKALTCVREPFDVEEGKARLSAMCEEMTKLDSRARNLYQVEVQARNELHERMRKLDGQIQASKTLTRHPGLKTISTEPLTWRDEKGNPLIVVYALNSPTFSFSGSKYALGGPNEVTPGYLPDVVRACYADCVKMLRERSYGRETFTRTTTFGGVIPEETKAVISHYSTVEHFGTSHAGRYDEGRGIFLMAEAGVWTEQKKVAPKPPVLDPIVIGHHNGILFVLDVFDPTPLEQYIADEFSA